MPNLPQDASAVGFWKSDLKGAPCNGGKGQPVSVGVREKSPGPLSLCHAGTLHATMNPDKWKGQRLWIVALYGETAREEDKFGALEREILAEVV